MNKTNEKYDRVNYPVHVAKFNRYAEVFIGWLKRNQLINKQYMQVFHTALLLYNNLLYSNLEGITIFSNNFLFILQLHVAAYLKK